MLPHLSTPLRLRVMGVGALALAVTGAVMVHPVTPERARLTAAGTSQNSFRQLTTTSAFRGGTTEGLTIATGR